ncbi:MAG: O-antigen ligase family protein [Fastidiosipila sp.]|nr:O-antigen ligase family protein [Fastidiosipila sp.]
MAKAKKKRAAAKPSEEELLLSRQERLDNKIMVVLLLIIALVPLITRMVVLPHVAPTISGNILDTGMKGNAFTYLKMNLLILLTGAAALLFLYKMVFLKYHIKPSFINIPTAALFILILLSCLFSSYSSVATTGIFTRHEGTLTYVMYMTLFFIAANIQVKPKYLDYVVYALAPIVIVNGVLGLLGFYGVDILENSTVQSLVISPEVAKYMTEGSVLDTTIDNPNYVSGIASVIFMIFLTRFLFSERRTREAIIHYILLLFTFAMLLAATSASGFLTIMVIVPFIMVPAFLRGRVVPVLLKSVGLLASLVLVYIKLNAHNQAVYYNTLGSLPNITVIPVMVLAVVLAIVIGVRYKGFRKGIVVLAALVLITGLIYSDKLQTIPPFNQLIRIAETYSTVDSDPVSLVPDENGVLNLPSPKPSLDSGRIYIWTLTMDLIKEKPILGYGLDTLGYYFPHYDLKGAEYLSSNIVDKPHNMYLAMAFGSGIPALLAFLIIVVLYLKENVFLYSTKINTHRKIMLLCILGGCLAYLFQGNFNDSIIGTAPLFWILLGMGISLLHQEKHSIEGNKR